MVLYSYVLYKEVVAMVNKKGVTLIELLAVTVILGIIAIVATVLIGNLISKTRLSADQQTLINLNYAVSMYDVDYPNQRIVDSTLSKEAIFELLVEKGYLSHLPVLQSKNSEFLWDEVLLVFKLNIGGDILPLSPFGDTPEQIVPNFIDIMELHLENGGNLTTWGDSRYTNLGLDPNDWSGYILHVHYRPHGKGLILEVENGYQFVFNKINGDQFTISSAFNWNLIYNMEDGKWYYNSIDPAKEFDIDTLIVELT